MNARPLSVAGEADELEQLVAAIRARASGHDLPAPPPDALAALIAHLRDEEPMSEDELAQHEREWRAVEEELRAVDRADEQRESRLSP